MTTSATSGGDCTIGSGCSESSCPAAAASRRLRKQLPTDEHPADLGRPRADLVKLRVTPQSCDRVLVDVAVADQRLNGRPQRPGCLSGRGQVGARGVLAE